MGQRVLYAAVFGFTSLWVVIGAVREVHAIGFAVPNNYLDDRDPYLWSSLPADLPFPADIATSPLSH